MNKETLACDPNRWQSQTAPSQIEAELAFYGLEHGRSPEYLGANGIFVIGYYYRLYPERNTIHSFNPQTGKELKKDVREMFDVSTPRGRREKKGFEKLTRLFFEGDPGDIFVWLSPAEENLYPYPRLYFAQKKEANLIEAYDLNTDLSFAQLRELLYLLSKQEITAQNSEEILGFPLLLRQEGPQIIFESLKKVGVKELHGVPLDVVENQFREKVWEKLLLENRSLASKVATEVWESVDQENFYQARLWVAWYEEAIRKQGGFFAPRSSCGGALTANFSPKAPFYYGLPIFGLEITRSRTCPVCGWPLLSPVPVGGHCPHCGTERKC
ncbi:hypothetical protein KBI33_00950 [Candidatus Shapirobacteria bacterium]|nr:hypothetical protein [Candidatus Shapirobacteria bacterium]